MQKHALLSAAIILSTSFALAQDLPLDPHKTWKVFETEHFEVIYDEPDRALAENFANEAERANTLLQPILKIPPRNKIPLVIADVTDSSNGAASAIPRPEIEVFPVLPSVFDPTSEYYSWTREVITHEYTHILNFEPVSGFMKVLRFIFGSIITPGGYLPRWYTEGLAVEMESRMTPVGRGRSHYYSALARAMAESGTLGSESIDRLNPTTIPTWPRGQRPYTYGYFLMHHLSEMNLTAETPKEDQGAAIYGVLDHRFGGRFPWFINGPMKDYFDRDWAGLLAATYEDLNKRVSLQLQKLKSGWAKAGAPMQQSGYFNFGAVISPDHLKLAAIVSDYNDYPGIRVWTRKTPTDSFSQSKDVPVLINGKDIHQLSWRADSRYIIYDRSDTYRHYLTYNDLYEFDTSKNDEKQLTEGLRAREATVMPDGSLVFVVASSTKTQLMHSDAQGKNPALVYSPADGDRVSSPRPFEDGVIYSHRDSKGKEWIETVSLKTKNVRTLTQASKIGEIHMMPVADPVKDGAFYYASSASGVMNIYHSDHGHTEPMTNTTTYASSPAIDSTGKQLIFTRLTSTGFELESDALKVTPAPAPISALQSYPKADESPPPKAQISEEHSYHGVSYLFPQYLLPFIFFVPGGTIIDISSSASDPLNHHQYAFDVGYDTRANQPWEDFMYTNSSLPFFIDANFANDYVYLAGGGFTEHIIFGYLDSRHFLARNNNRWTIGPELTYKETDYSTLVFTQMGPGVYLSYKNIATVKDYQISPEGGEAFEIGYDYFLGNWGNTQYPNIHGDFSYYLSGKPLPNHHVMSLKGSAWVSPQQATILTGANQAGGEVFGSLYSPSSLVRGYSVGEFIGWTTYVGNFEYRFPLAYPYSGGGTFPLFFNKWSGALLLDAITLQGGYYDSTVTPSPLVRTDIGTFYLGTGGELRVDTQLFYGIPITWRLGVYYGFTQKAYGGASYLLSLGSIQ